LLRFFSPFRWLWIIIGVLFLATMVAGLAFFVSDLVLGHPLFTVGRFYPFVFFPFFSFGGIIFLFLIIGFGLRMIFRPWRRWGWGYYGGRGYYSEDPAMQSLRVRYARGEITKEQFDVMASDLEKHRSS
jgi:hypothetical protein